MTTYLFENAVTITDYTIEWQPTGKVWVAYYCGCSECHKGIGKTQEEAVADLIERCHD
jgi:predicted RNase H-like HicB family nuclease